MIISFLFKVLLLYFLYLFFRGVFRTYSTIKLFKDQAQGSQTQRSPKPQGHQGADVFEAEYKVLHEDEASKSHN